VDSSALSLVAFPLVDCRERGGVSCQGRVGTGQGGRLTARECVVRLIDAARALNVAAWQIRMGLGL
jgi:hypothetical protein